MKLTGNLKKQVEKAGSKDEKKSLIKNAGMLLNDEELEMVSGGAEEGNIQTQYIEFRDALDGREQRDGDDNDGGGNGGGIGTVQWITN